MYETCALLHLNEDDVADDDDHDIFSADEHDAPFYNFLYVCIGVIAGILVLGTAFEVVRRWKFKKSKGAVANEPIGIDNMAVNA